MISENFSFRDVEMNRGVSRKANVINSLTKADKPLH